MRAALRAASSALAHSAGAADGGHPAADACAQAQAWADRAREAARRGDDEDARRCAQNARQCGDATRALLENRDAAAPYPAAGEPVSGLAEGRAAQALAGAAGAGDVPVVARADGGQSVAWSQDGFAGSATIYPGDERNGHHPRARVVFTDLDRDRYEALANSPWPYRTEDGAVVYERLPADQAAQVIEAAAGRRPGTPWRRHGLTAGINRDPMDEYEAEEIEDESYSWSQSLSGQEEDYINAYTASEPCDEINRALYRQRSPEEPVPSLGVPLREVTAHLDAALERAPRPDQPHVTYRGFVPPLEVRKADRVLEWAHANFTVGGVYRDRSYMSVSHCPDVAAGFSRNSWWTKDGSNGKTSHGVVFEVVSSRGAALAAVSEFENQERERLLPRDSVFHVVGIRDNVRIGGQNKVVIQMVDVHDVRRF
ncbi:ADP-ribosyltransferase [Streptomyces yaizuensis]|uniref:ADP-ribosyltransferase domain-containing protein n=1 Tax=Streptomyces yaizuensis TaxID=2989713 RepID=A0ABQ5P6Q2_9ACTN|nr:ADP-ribosyltransferase [Streptomyces sp. YSPA8]GLF98242.1 ADP-ribosyltransferase domain-containing protein [Streptomyces sp. YSPA8]